MPRLYCPLPLVCGSTLDLPAAAARHVQVLRLQPGDTVTLFIPKTPKPLYLENISNFF